MVPWMRNNWMRFGTVAPIFGHSRMRCLRPMWRSAPQPFPRRESTHWRGMSESEGSFWPWTNNDFACPGPASNPSLRRPRLRSYGTPCRIGCHSYREGADRFPVSCVGGTNRGSDSAPVRSPAESASFQIATAERRRLNSGASRTSRRYGQSSKRGDWAAPGCHAARPEPAPAPIRHSAASTPDNTARNRTSAFASPLHR